MFTLEAQEVRVAVQRPSAEDPFDTWLLYYIDQSGMTNAEIAAHLEVDRATISKWTGGVNVPSVHHLEGLVNILRIRGDERSQFYRRSGRFPSGTSSAPASSVKPVLTYVPPVLDADQFIVGRESELQQFDHFLASPALQILNVSGPGGIGKSVLSKLLNRHATTQGVPAAFVDGTAPALTPVQILSVFTAALSQHETVAPFLAGMERELHEYTLVQHFIYQGAGLEALFNTGGTLRNPRTMEDLLGAYGHFSQTLQHTLSNRYALEVYLRRIDLTLTQSFAQAVESVIDRHPALQLLLVLDTYETMEENLDDWVCQDLVPRLPVNARFAILGRNALTRVNPDWSDWHHRLWSTPLQELPETHAKAFLRHHGLTDSSQLQRIYDYVRGYPLLLVLAAQLARELGGWETIDGPTNSGTHEFIAQHLLERIMREERLQPIREFLEKGVVAPWFNAEVVAEILQISAGDGLIIYNQLQRHSFIERHPYGMKFHDKIRDVLLARLKIVSPVEYVAIATRLRDYFAQKAESEQAVARFSADNSDLFS